MALQHSNTRLHDLSHSVVISFQLVGRTTLSEHLLSEIIEVNLKTVLRSPYILSLVKELASTLQFDTLIEVPNIDPAGFRLYIEYVQNGRITYLFRSSSSISSGLLLRDCVDLIYAHIVGTRLGDVDFQDYIIDEIDRRLDPAQTPDSKVFEVIFVEKGTSNALKRFATDKMFAMDRRMLGMLKGNVKDVVEHEDETRECEYHVHVKGGCYRTARMREAGGQAKRATPTWNVDQDPELQSMAAHYLGGANERPTPQNIPTATSPSLRDGENETNRCPSLSVRTTSNENAGRSTLHMQVPDPHYFGSAAWSRDVYNASNQAYPFAPFTRRDKPLPEIPHPRRPCSASRSAFTTLPLIPSTFLSNLNPSSQLVSVESGGSVQDLIAECLGHISSPHQEVSTQDLITDCLSRLSSTEEQSALVKEHTDPNLLNTEIPTSRNPSPSQPDLRLSLQPSRPSLSHPQPSRITSSISSHSSHILAMHPPSPTPAPPFIPNSSSPLTLARMITRKPAPPRGLDWMEQWERLDALRGTQGFGLRTNAKVDRKTKFRELLGG